MRTILEILLLPLVFIINYVNLICVTILAFIKRKGVLRAYHVDGPEIIVIDPDTGERVD